jgi:hypothetical protein
MNSFWIGNSPLAAQVNRLLKNIVGIIFFLFLKKKLCPKIIRAKFDNCFSLFQ